jgi:uncharacterized protein
MSERGEYPAGVPCWVDVLHPEPELAFYRDLFGWEIAGPGPIGYHVARLGGRDVAGIGTGAVGAWTTYVRVDSAAEAAARAAAAGGTVLAGPLDALPAGRVAAFADPTGAAIGVWEPVERAGAQVVNEPGTWMMSSLHSPDPAAAAPFYAAVFGWQTETFGPAGLFRLEGYAGDAGQAIPPDTVAAIAAPDPGIPPHWNVNFRAADADALAARVPELGGRVLMAPFDTPGFRSAVIQDPQGAVFSVSQVL